jgi:hypothetical protein
MNTYISKDWSKNWVAKTTIDLDNREVSITTRKTSNGLLNTFVSVGTREGMFVSHKMYQDFMKTYWSTNPKRVTEKAVTTQHNDFLATVLDDVLVAIDEFYSKETA